jgi:hypothetical protein
MDLRIDLLKMNILTASGQEHRIQPIALRAATVLAERLSAHQIAGARATSRTVDAVTAPPVSIDMGRLGDKDAADHIVDACFAALLQHLEG